MPAEKVLQEGNEFSDRDFADHYRLYLMAVYNFCLFNLGDPDLAEEVTAQTFEKAWRYREEYNPNLSSFSTWIIAIARNLVRDTQRRRARQPEPISLNEDFPDITPLPETRALNHEKLARLRSQILKLKPDERELVALKFGACLTNRKIAEILNKSETAVGTMLYRIMRKLRAGLEM